MKLHPKYEIPHAIPGWNSYLDITDIVDMYQARRNVFQDGED